MSDPKDPKNNDSQKDPRDPGGSGGNSGGGNSGGDDGKQPQGPRNPNVMSRGMVSWLLMGGLVVALFLMFASQQSRPDMITWSEFKSHIDKNEFKDEKGSVVVESSQIVGELKDGIAGSVDGEMGKKVAFAIDSDTKALYVDKLDAAKQPYILNTSSGIMLHLLVSWGPLFIIAFLIYFFFIRSLRNAGGGPGMLGSFGRSRHKVVNKEHSTVTLADVAGIEEAKDEIGEIIEFLKNPKKFQRLGGRVPRGVLLIGSPGCGKTLLAKAVAGEAEVPFFSISGSDFVEMFVGVGASRVRDLFKQAKDSSPCIIFLDEIDAVGRRRGNGYSSGGHDEREQTLNAILVEMDGFESNDQVIVIAATNRSDVLDPALTRPGRFDRQIHVSLPDIKGRAEIFKVHSRKIKMSPDVDLEKLARGTPMFSGADLAAIVNEAAIGATLQNKDFVEQDDLEEARDKVKWGRSRKSHKIEEDERKVIAYHEAGHAIVMYFDEHAEPLHKVTIIPRGQALGVTFMLPEKDRHIHTKKQLLAQLRVTYGGRIAEDMFCGDISSGASQDIRQASSIARAMITELGMSDKLGFQLYGVDESRQPWEQPDKMFSDETARLIDQEVKGLIDRTYGETKDLIEKHREQLEALAQALLKYETLNRDEVDRIMRGEQLTKATVSDLLQAEKDKAAAAEKKPEPQRENDLGDEPPGVMPSPA
jgi:cell division protease FtsH